MVIKFTVRPEIEGEIGTRLAKKIRSYFTGHIYTVSDAKYIPGEVDHILSLWRSQTCNIPGSERLTLNVRILN